MRLKDIDAAVSFLGCSLIELISELDYSILYDDLYFTGSIVDGFGNVGSDIDVVVVSERNPITIGPIYKKSLRRWVDFKHLTPGDLARLESRLSTTAKVPTNWGAVNPLRYGEADMLHRLKIALPLAIGRNHVELISSFPDDDINIASAIYHLYTARNLWVDSAGAFVSKQYAQSAYTAQMGLERTLDAYAAIYDETNPNAKWHYSKIQRLKKDELSLKDSVFSFKLAEDSLRAGKLLKKLGWAIFGIMHRLSFYKFPESMPNLPPSKRYELLNKRVIIYNADTSFNTL